MKHVKKSVLLWYSPHEMYQLVTAVKDYPKFLPWCERADVLETHSGGMTARLHLHYAGVRHAFTTRNEHAKDESVIVALVDGPFSKLDGTWKFVRLGSHDKACKIEFDMRYAFSSLALEAMVSPVFDKIANTFVDSFVKRAEQVYGPR
ncbi:type II toxin-antitoxin system RatA family toxin [Piscinibacter sp. XHJ-5]|uniref:type II toxin-antitoxin system RatA family toxin n=1 Tax=Piscinibacter sp. XHJ-5 TaxID=3037797 RepID=UPI002452EA57|nr:type II toxin-antitoxin system RatA family toxin [Piscinibacter sp. XHJ-5]